MILKIVVLFLVGMGVLAMFGAIGILFVLPWLDTSKVRSMRYRPLTRWFFIFFVIVALLLGWCGVKNPDDFVCWITKPRQREMHFTP